MNFLFIPYERDNCEDQSFVLALALFWNDAAPETIGAEMGSANQLAR